MILDEVEVVAVERLSPTFVRVELGGPALADFGVDGPLYDQRIKLVFPHESGVLPSFEGADESWFDTWLDLPVEERGHMRTYTVRDVRGDGADTRLVVDFVLHLDEGATGPGSPWAAQAARPGDRLVTLAPRRGAPFGGIEFVPGHGPPPAARRRRDRRPGRLLDPGGPARGIRGRGFLEVPATGDVLDVERPGRRGGRLAAARRRAAGGAAARGRGGPPRRPGRRPSLDVADDDVDPDLWETPTYSSSGETLRGRRGRRHGLTSTPGSRASRRSSPAYAATWCAELGIDRRQVAFMGYWRRGVAMRS